jgi:class 3 adenylate cyclase
MRVAHYEIYEARFGQWALKGRYPPREEAIARARAEKNWTDSRTPTVMLQENVPEGDDELDVSVVYRSPEIKQSYKAPDSGGSMAGSLVTVAINGVIIGAVGAIIAAIALAGSPARFFLSFLAFLIISAAAMMVLFRMMVPAELMIWRNKTTEAKRKTIEALSIIDDADTSRPPPVSNPNRVRRQRKGAFSHPKGEAVIADGVKAQNFGGDLGDDLQGQAAKLQELVARQVLILQSFASDMMTTLGPRAGSLQAFDRYGLNLYIAGAAQELAWREKLTEQTMVSILTNVLTEQNTSLEAAKAFADRLETASNRPRFRAMMDAGRSAMVATLDAQPIPSEVAVDTVLSNWSNPHGNVKAGQRIAVLLTDLVGSTDATRKLGNSGAQRLLRAHNAIVRDALRTCRGQEVKHTGDGILCIFNSPGDAGNAAVAIQQDAFAYVRENPDLPLAIRIGIEYGEGMKDETGEYFGPAITAIEGICDAGGSGDIAVSPAVKDQTEGAILQYTELTPNPTAKSFVTGLYKLMWQPKPVYSAPPLEYRQIGTSDGTIAEAE